MFLQLRGDWKNLVGEKMGRECRWYLRHGKLLITPDVMVLCKFRVPTVGLLMTDVALHCAPFRDVNFKSHKVRYLKSYVIPPMLISKLVSTSFYASSNSICD